MTTLNSDTFKTIIYQNAPNSTIELLVYMRMYIYTIICLKSVDVRKLQVAILARSPREMS